MILFVSKQKTGRLLMPHAIKLGLSAVLLALTTGANSSENSAVPFAYNSWQTPASEALDLPNLRGQGLSFAEQYQNKLLGEWSLQRINGRAKMEHDPWVQETVKEMTWRLNAQAREQAPLGLVIIDNPSINAFAVLKAASLASIQGRYWLRVVWMNWLVSSLMKWRTLANAIMRVALMNVRKPC